MPDMKKMPPPKLLAAVLGLGTVLLVGGTAYAVSLPSQGAFWQPGTAQAAAAATGTPAAPTASPTAARPATPTTKAPAPTALPATPAPTRSANPTTASITYTVKANDTLTGIAEWFRLHGYGSLYAANAKVIGADPDLIRPGQRITISGGVMTIQPHA